MFSTRHLQCPFGIQRQKPYEEAEGRASAKREFDGTGGTGGTGGAVIKSVL